MIDFWVANIKIIIQSKEKEILEESMSGGFEYNMTTETQYQEMKQRNYQLEQENQALKQSLEQLIKINNELTDSMEQFNNHALKNNRNKPQIDQKNEELAEELEYYKNLVYANEDKNQIISALQGLIDSFNQTQKLYEQEISNICEELDHYKTQWQNKLQSYEKNYIAKLKSMDQLITQLRKKQEIVSIIEKKMEQERLNGNKKDQDFDGVKNGEMDRLQTYSQKKADETNHLMKSSKFTMYQKQIQLLREREKHLSTEINNKNKTISAYTELINKLKKKIMEKY